MVFLIIARLVGKAIGRRRVGAVLGYGRNGCSRCYGAAGRKARVVVIASATTLKGRLCGVVGGTAEAVKYVTLGVGPKVLPLAREFELPLIQLTV